MSRFGFAHCPDCGRLNIHGATCPCTQTPEWECDCTYDGNRQNIGPVCSQRISDTWKDAINRSHEIARHLAERENAK